MYSQNNEEEIAINYFLGRAGSLLSIGENDGRTFSNVLALIESGWEGTLIEPSPQAFKRLCAEHDVVDRQGVQLLNVAVGSHDGDLEFNESGSLLGRGDVALVSSSKQEELDRWSSLNIVFEKMKVPMVSFETLLSMAAYKTYDLISIDIEGMEYEVVPQINFTDLGTKMAIIEWNGKNAEYYDRLLLRHNLRLIHTNAENRIYCK